MSTVIVEYKELPPDGDRREIYRPERGEAANTFLRAVRTAKLLFGSGLILAYRVELWTDGVLVQIKEQK